MSSLDLPSPKPSVSCPALPPHQPRDPTPDTTWLLRGLLACSASALVMSACMQPTQASPLHLSMRGEPHATTSGVPVAPEPLTAGFEVASEMEDRMLGFVRQVDTRVDSALESIFDVVSGPRGERATEGGEGPSDEMQRGAEKLIREVWEVVDKSYLDVRSTRFERGEWAAVRDRALSKTYKTTTQTHRALREMLTYGLEDPYSRFISPAELATMKKYDVTGVGLNLGSADEYERKVGKLIPNPPSSSGASVDVGASERVGLFVVGVSRGSASDAQGIEQGDEIVSIGDRSVSGLTSFEAASLIQEASKAPQGSQGSSISIKVEVRKADGGELQALQVLLPTNQVAPSPVTTRVSTEEVRGSNGLIRVKKGYVKLSSFNALAHRDLSTALDRLLADGVDSLILDLRDNRGGLVTEGLEVARLFIGSSEALLVSQSRSGPDEIPRARAGPAPFQLPLVVLVNNHTASAAEILAGALKDSCRAVLVGGRTYGKGLIQSVYELSDGSGMALTVGRYLTPARVDIDRAGIEPSFSSEPDDVRRREALDACLISKKNDQAVG